jgi:hypothetical protein
MTSLACRRRMAHACAALTVEKEEGGDRAAEAECLLVCEATMLSVVCSSIACHRLCYRLCCCCCSCCCDGHCGTKMLSLLWQCDRCHLRVVA